MGNQKKNNKNDGGRKEFLFKLYLTLGVVILASVGLFIYVYLEIRQTLTVIVPLEQIINNDKREITEWQKVNLPIKIFQYLNQNHPVSELIGSKFSERLFLVFTTPHVPRSSNTITTFAYVKKRETPCFLSLYGVAGPLQYESLDVEMKEYFEWTARFSGTYDTIVAKSTCGNTMELFRWWGKHFERVPLLSLDETCFVDLQGTCNKRRNFTYDGLDSHGNKMVCDDRFKNLDYIICR